MSKSVTREDLIHAVAGRSGVGLAETRRVLEATFKVIPDIVTSGKQIQIKGFGTFKSVTRKERIGRNPATGEQITIPEKNVPVFKFSKNL